MLAATVCSIVSEGCGGPLTVLAAHDSKLIKAYLNNKGAPDSYPVTVSDSTIGMYASAFPELFGSPCVQRRPLTITCVVRLVSCLPSDLSLYL